MRPSARSLAGPLLALGTAVLTLLVVEGATELVTGRGIVRGALEGRGGAGVAAELPPVTGAEATTPGPWAVDLDPLVGVRIKSDWHGTILGAQTDTDAYGQRVRVGPPAAPGAPRVLLLGDSVAFGHGVRDDETYAHGLEEALAATLADGAVRPVVETAACPGWNHRNSFRYLRDHVERLAPDVVLYMAVDNDLDDGFEVSELGWKSVTVDPSLGPDLPVASIETRIRLVTGLTVRPSLAAISAVVAAGGPRAVPYALSAGLTPESNRRWDALVADVQHLRDELSARGIRFGVVLFRDGDFEREFELRLLAAAPELPLVGMYAGFGKADQLEGDPHPNPRCVRAGARWLAADLIARGWVPGTGVRPLPGPDPEYAGRQMALLPPAERERLAEERHDLVRRFLHADVDHTIAEGIYQVYGGLAGDGTVGRHLWVALRNDGAKRVALTLERLGPGRAVWPLELSFACNGVEAGTVAVPPPAAGEGAVTTVGVALPEAVRTAPLVDVLVRASRWVEERRTAAGAVPPRLASFRLRRIELVP